MWIAFENTAIHKRTGVSFIGVADYVLLCPDRLCDCAPFQASWVAGTTAASQAADRNLSNHLLRRHRGQHFYKGSIALLGNVLFNPLRIDCPRVLEDDFFLALKKRRVRGTQQLLNRKAVEAVEDRTGIRRRNVLV